MFVIDITRQDDNYLNNDLMLGKKSSDTKEKIINYVYDYTLANCDMSLNRNDLDKELDIKYFSLKDYCFDKYGMEVDKKLIVQAIPTENDKYIIVKSFNKNVDDKPITYLFSKEDEKKAKGLMAYMINDDLIQFLGEQDKMDEYEKEKKDIQNYDDMSFSYGDQKYEYYNGGLFLEELLNNSISYKQIQNVKEKDIEI